jgi:gliding motility-associated-like protein
MLYPTDYSLQIFNNWGQLLFETRDYNSGWDGRFNGIPLNHGVYAWKITYSISTPGLGNHDLNTLQGTVLLVR